MLKIALAVLLFLAACAPATEPIPLPTLASLELAAAPSLLNSGQTVTGNLPHREAVEIWRYEGRAGERIRVRAVEVAALLTLRDGAGVPLAEGQMIVAELPADGVYQVEVRLREGQPGVYRLLLEPAPDPTPYRASVTPLPERVGVPTPTPPYFNLGNYQGTARIGAVLAGSYTGADAHVYAYDGSSGELITLWLEAESGFDPALALYDPRGQLIGQDDDAGGGTTARLLNIALNQTGIYSVQVTGRTAGEYTLQIASGGQTPEPESLPATATLTPSPYATPTIGALPDDGRLQDHSPAFGTLDRSGDFARFAIDVRAGQTISMLVQPFGDSGLRPQLELYGPEGRPVATALSSTSNAGGAALLVGVPIAEDGSLVALITGESGSRGGFIVAYGTGDSALSFYQGQASAGAVLRSNIARRAQRDEWRLALKAGDNIAAAVRAVDSPIDPVLSLADETGTVLATGDVATGLPGVVIPADGVYTLRVIDRGGRTTGAYELIWRYNNQAATPTPGPGALTLLALDDTVEPESYNFYAFQGRAGQRIAAEVIAADGSDLDPVAALVAPDGEIIAEADDTGGDLNPRFGLVLPMDGTYRLRVNGYLSGGTFRLAVRLLLDSDDLP